ncbi:MAG TPA: ATP-binding protein [Steroidobacteraceae bacterium]|nr:ATP-binding protein [Steroidobacteraceae bacterium]
MSSIRGRLLVALTLLVVVASALAAGVTYRRVLSETSSLFDYQLRQMALSLVGQISLAPRIEVPRNQSDVDFVVQIWDPFGARVYLSRPGLPWINQAVLGFADVRLQGRTWRTYGLQTGDGVIQIAQPAFVREQLARAAALRVAVPIMLLLPVMVLCLAWIVRRSLKPLSHVTADIQRRDARSLAPLPSSRLPGELRPLVDELNRLLDRLQESFAAQRAFIADAAHELRSPLTALRLQLQLFDRAPDDAARSIARVGLGGAVERSIHLVEQLLTLARSEPQELAPSAQNVDLRSIAAQAIADTHPLASARSIELSLDGESPAFIRGDADALRALVRNLVDNAVRYSPPGGSVRVRCEAQAGRVRLRVTDSGPGIPPADRARVFDRFHRQPGRQELGTGLGLAIVKAVAARHGAAVNLGDAPGGGLEVQVDFPT